MIVNCIYFVVGGVAYAYCSCAVRVSRVDFVYKFFVSRRRDLVQIQTSAMPLLWVCSSSKFKVIHIKLCIVLGNHAWPWQRGDVNYRDHTYILDINTRNSLWSKRLNHVSMLVRHYRPLASWTGDIIILEQYWTYAGRIITRKLWVHHMYTLYAHT